MNMGSYIQQKYNEMVRITEKEFYESLPCKITCLFLNGEYARISLDDKYVILNIERGLERCYDTIDFSENEISPYFERQLGITSKEDYEAIVSEMALRRNEELKEERRKAYLQLKEEFE